MAHESGDKLFTQRDHNPGNVTSGSGHKFGVGFAVIKSLDVSGQDGEGMDALGTGDFETGNDFFSFHGSILLVSVSE